MQVGDTIKCHDEKEAVELIHGLSEEGIEVDLAYNINGQKGLWLIITKINKHKEENNE